MSYRGIKYSKYTSQRAFGVELEISNNVSKDELWEIITDHSHRFALMGEWSQTHNNRYWHIKTDSTCGPLGKGQDFGYEVASYKGQGIRDLLHIATVAGLLRTSGAKVNSNCGLHVHADISDFKPSQVGVLLGCWCQCESFLFSCVPSHRYFNQFCHPIRRLRPICYDRHYRPKEFWDLIRPRNLAVFENPERRVALNVMNYATGLVRKRWTRKTVELRMPEGTLDPHDIKNWIRLFVHFVECCRTRRMPSTVAPLNAEDSLSVLGLGHDDYFNIYSPGLTETRIWLLERCLRHGWGEWWTQARRLLNIISTPLKSY